MAKLVVLVMSSVNACEPIMRLWTARGVTGVTLVESLGLHKILQAYGRRDDLPLIPSLRHLFEEEEYRHRTAFAVVGDDFDLQGLLDATEEAVGGDFNAPNSGIVFVLPVLEARGLHPHWTRKDK